MPLSADAAGPPALPRPVGRALAVAGLLLVPLLYLVTLARTPVLGDPTEYTFVAHILGIAHPPGYAFFTLVGHLFQRFVPLGDIPWRMHLTAAVAATVAATAVYGTVHAVAARAHAPWPRLSALFAALVTATAVDLWQHAIHANPHVVTAAFLAGNVFLLTRWALAAEGAPSPNRWLYAFSLSAGLGVTHHPLTVFAFPAYALFIIALRPSILREGRALLTMLAWAALGLAPWLYFPLRSPAAPFGPTDMNTLDGFLNIVLARGLRVNLFHFGPSDQGIRALVFWSLLRLQYSLPIIALALVGVAGLARRAAWPSRRLLLLIGLAWFGNYLFIINTVQDVMAYLLGPFLLIGLCAGLGLAFTLTWLAGRGRQSRGVQLGLIVAALLFGPVAQITSNSGLVSLRDYDDGARYVTAVFEQFAGRGAGAVLLNDWEHMTPLWYAQFVEQRWPDPADVRPTFVSAARPWLPSVFDHLPGGPVYLSGYRRDIVDAGFRLRPWGDFYQVVEPGEASVPVELTPAAATAGPLVVDGYLLPDAAAGGDYVPLTLALHATEPLADFYVPVVTVGDLTFRFTTDSHLTTPNWLPGEVIVERFDFALPPGLAAGAYPVRLGLFNLSQDADAGLDLPLGTLRVSDGRQRQAADDLLANFRHRAGLAGATARRGLDRRSAPWTEPLPARPGDTIQLTLRWRSLLPAEESYTVFVHLIDAANQSVIPPLDYTPLGGATPTYLWIPKWLPGQQMLDPYRMTLPPDLAPGTYWIEVGLYEMTSGRRLHMADPAGNLAGDRYILGPVVVQAPNP